jgi:hypothetical protein
MPLDAFVKLQKSETQAPQGRLRVKHGHPRGYRAVIIGTVLNVWPIGNIR